jgi:hypothetical protein
VFLNSANEREIYFACNLRLSEHGSYEELTPWNRVLLEKLTGFQLVKKFPAINGTGKLITAYTSARLTENTYDNMYTVGKPFLSLFSGHPEFTSACMEVIRDPQFCWI